MIEALTIVGIISFIVFTSLIYIIKILENEDK